MTPDQIKVPKYWIFPKPKMNYLADTFSIGDDIKVSQQKFYDEYHTSGHKINSPLFYPDIPILNAKKKIVDYHRVNRITLPFQKEAITIVLAHFLGYKTQFNDSTVGENNVELMSMYKEFWNDKDMDVLRNDLIKSILAVGDGAALFYRDTNTKTFKWKVLSYLDGEQIYEKKDKFGQLEYFGRFYTQINDEGKLTNYCDLIDAKYYDTYVNDEKGWTLISHDLHGFSTVPVVYYFRKEGSFCTPVQNNIDNLEVMLSRLSEDNRTKAKARYHIAVDDPNTVQTKSTGTTDLVITPTTGKFSLISGADISTSFKFEWETELEIISNYTGMVFPKSKSSGDMPTGSMKMMFFPTERIVFQLINEFDIIINKINTLFKEGMIYEKSDMATDLANFKVKAYTKMFSPQDDSAVMTTLTQGITSGALSKQTARENAPYAANDENKRCDEEQAAESAQLALEANQVVNKTTNQDSNAANQNKA